MQKWNRRFSKCHSQLLWRTQVLAGLHRSAVLGCLCFLQVHKGLRNQGSPCLAPILPTLLLDASMTSVFSDDEKDMTFSLSSKHSTSSTASSSISSPSETQSEWDDRKWIVHESHLMRLFRTCHKCGIAITEKKVTKSGSQIKVERTCKNGHNDKWSSCPDTRGMAQNNLLVPAAVLFTEIQEWAKLLSLQLPKKTQYYSVQSYIRHTRNINRT